MDGGTEVTETWELPPEGSAFFEKMFGDDAAKEIGMRSDGARTVLPRRWRPSRASPRPEPHACPTARETSRRYRRTVDT